MVLARALAAKALARVLAATSSDWWAGGQIYMAAQLSFLIRMEPRQDCLILVLVVLVLFLLLVCVMHLLLIGLPLVT